jgi:hypothetical protein
MTQTPFKATVTSGGTTVAGKSLTRLATRHTGTVTMGGRPVSGVALSAGISYVTVVSVAAQAAESEGLSDVHGRFPFRFYPSTSADRLSVWDSGILPELAPFYFRPTPAKVSAPSDLRTVTLAIDGAVV